MEIMFNYILIFLYLMWIILWEGHLHLHISWVAGGGLGRLIFSNSMSCHLFLLIFSILFSSFLSIRTRIRSSFFIACWWSAIYYNIDWCKLFVRRVTDKCHYFIYFSERWVIFERKWLNIKSSLRILNSQDNSENYY
jgi:hypothetical protein